MFRKILTAFGLGFASVAGGAATPPYSPYLDAAANEIYNLLFCDNLSSFAPRGNHKPQPQLETLFADPPDIPALEKFANDSSQEGRLRSIAYWRLRIAGKRVSTKILLGVIVETPLTAGLDTLAAFSEGGVRYINQTGKMAFFADCQKAVAEPHPTSFGRGPRRGPAQELRNSISIRYLKIDFKSL